MPKDEFVMRGKTADFKTTAAFETLNFSGYKPGYAYRLVEFSLYPSTTIGSATAECLGSITAGKTVADPENPDFDQEGLIGTAVYFSGVNNDLIHNPSSIVNDTFLITQNLLLTVADVASGGNDINWQCRFVAEKMSGPEEAVANYKQFTISDGS